MKKVTNSGSKFLYIGIFGSTPTKTEGKLEKRLIFYTPPNRGDRDAEKLCPDWENEEGQTRQIKDKAFKEFSLCWKELKTELFI